MPVRAMAVQILIVLPIASVTAYAQEADRGLGSPPAPTAADSTEDPLREHPEPLRLDLPEPTFLSRLYELDPETEHDRFRFRPHRTTYFLPARYSSDPNERPASPRFPAGESLGQLDSVEVKFQLSAKMKLLEASERMNFWVAYTQQNNWQFYQQSSPFRETNYEPEGLLVVNTGIELGPVTWRSTYLGVLHQSNGRDGAQSRSWNRVTAEFGLEYRNLTLMIRPWWRIPESSIQDDNDDVEDFLGHGDVTAIYEHGNWLFRGMARNNFDFDDNRGAYQLDVHAPLPFGVQRARLYLQAFHGYGESLIDYNHRQTTVGLGISLTDWAID